MSESESVSMLESSSLMMISSVSDDENSWLLLKPPNVSSEEDPSSHVERDGEDREEEELDEKTDVWKDESSSESSEIVSVGGASQSVGRTLLGRWTVPDRRRITIRRAETFETGGGFEASPEEGAAESVELLPLVEEGCS